MIRDIKADDYPEILRLNAEFVHWLSPLSKDELTSLLRHCDYARITDDRSGFLLGYDGNSAYRHKCVNYLSQHLKSYGYIDRIVITANAQGRGLARQLYGDFSNWAKKQNFAALGCEVNTVPDNPGSHRFHLRYGFTAIGDVHYAAFGKTLRYYSKTL